MVSLIMLSFSGQSCFCQHLLLEADWTLFLAIRQFKLCLELFLVLPLIKDNIYTKNKQLISKSVLSSEVPLYGPIPKPFSSVSFGKGTTRGGEGGSPMIPPVPCHWVKDWFHQASVCCISQMQVVIGRHQVRCGHHQNLTIVKSCYYCRTPGWSVIFIF